MLEPSALLKGSKLDALLVAAFRDYRLGLCRQPRAQPPMPSRNFDSLKFLGTLGWLPLVDRLHLRNLYKDSSEGLTAARQGRLEDAFGSYVKAKGSLDLLEHGARPAFLLGASTYEAGIAYLDFRCANAELAVDRLDRSMDADLELEAMGLPVMQMHRIQQGHNLVRMDLRRDRRESAVSLAGTLLAYMERQVDGLPYHRDWRPRTLQATSRSLLRGMIYQVIGETASFVVTGERQAQEWRLLIEASRLCEDPEKSVLPNVQYALRAQHDRLAGDAEGYLSGLMRFFRCGIRDGHRLWYVLMVEWIEFCRELGTSLSRQVQDAILRDSIKWKGLPPFLRARLERPLAEAAAVA